MAAESKLARLTGALYLIVVATGLFSLGYVPSRLALPADPQAAIAKLADSESWLRWGIASFLVEQVAFLLLPFALFRLLQGAGRAIAVSMVVLAVAGVPLALAGLSHRLDVLSLVSAARAAPTSAAPAWKTLIDLAFDGYRHDLLLASLFWGLWLLPFGYLAFASARLPRILGILLMAGGLGYVIDVFGSLLVADYPNTMASNYLTLPAAAGEIGACLWLLLAGLRPSRS